MNIRFDVYMFNSEEYISRSTITLLNFCPTCYFYDTPLIKFLFLLQTDPSNLILMFVKKSSD